MKVLHLSDLHLGYSYSQKPSSISLMNDTLVHSFERAVEYCIAEKVDILLLAGDIFHHSKPAYAVERVFLQALRRLDSAETVVVYCGGNHDPKGSLVHAASYQAISRFVSFINPAVETVTRVVRGVPVCFVGSGYEGKQNFASIAEYPKAMDVRTNSHTLVIGISHLSVDSKEAILTGEVYNATRLADLEALGYDYFALGHIHIRQILGESKNIAYSGNLQGLHVNETGDRGGLLSCFELSESGVWIVQTSEVNFSELRFEQHTLDVTDCLDYADLEYNIEMHLKEQFCDDVYRYIRIWLTGKCEFLEDLVAGIPSLEAYLAGGRVLGVEIKSEEVQSTTEMGEETLGGTILNAIHQLGEGDVVELKRKGILHRQDDLKGLVAFLEAQVRQKLR